MGCRTTQKSHERSAHGFNFPVGFWFSLIYISQADLPNLIFQRHHQLSRLHMGIMIYLCFSMLQKGETLVNPFCSFL